LGVESTLFTDKIWGHVLQYNNELLGLAGRVPAKKKDRAIL